jgi:hypothetical protein
MINQKTAGPARQISTQTGLTTCPREGKQVFPTEQRTYSAAGNNKPVIWWHCPLCGGWHVMKKYHYEEV